MAITSGASDGVRCDSAAKESVGNASTLGSQAAAAADEVIVPDAITANNEGNLASTPSYVGRMIAIRPWEMKVKSAALVAAGSSYAVNDTITLSGVAGVGGAPVITVDAVSSGAITAFTVTQAGAVEIRQGGMTSAPSPAANAVTQASTSGSGTGATFDVVWEPNFEIRYITADSSNTLTVHEAWINPPVSGDNWAVSYILDDCATLTGCTLRAQSGVYEFGRRLRIGPSTDGTRRGWLSMTDGVQAELDNVTDNNLSIEDGGLLTIGYEQGGFSVNGAYLSTSGDNAGARIELYNTAGAMSFIHDWQLRSPRESVVMNSINFTVAERLFHEQVRTICSRAKIYNVGTMSLTGYWKDVTLQQGDSAGEPFEMEIFYRFDGETVNASPAQAFYEGLRTVNHNNTSPLFNETGTQSGDPLELTLLDYIFVSGSNTNIIQPLGDQEVKFINPSFLENPYSSVQRRGVANLTVPADGRNVEMITLDVTITEPDQTPIADVKCDIYEGGNLKGLMDEPVPYGFRGDQYGIPARQANQSNTNSDGEYFTCMTVEDRTNDNLSGAAIFKAHSEFTAFRGYKYGKTPLLIPFEAERVGEQLQGRVFSFTMVDDTALTETVQADALTNPTTNPTVTKHGPGETDTRPMKALNYDAGTGGVAPTLGETLTQGSATGVVVEVLGDDVSGTVLLDTWNGTEFTDNQTITGGTSAFSATTNLSGAGSFYREYTWEVNAQGEAMTVVYDYFAARMAEATRTAEFEAVVVWGGNDPNASQMIQHNGSAFFTPRSLRYEDLRFGDIETPDFSDNFNRADEHLDANSNWNELGENGPSEGLEIISNVVKSGGFGVSSNQLAICRLDTSAYDFTGAAGLWAEIDIATLPASNETLAVGCVSADYLDSNGELREMFRLNVDSSGNIEVESGPGDSGGLAKVVDTGFNASVSDTLRMLVYGNQLVVYQNGTERWRGNIFGVGLFTNRQPFIHSVTNNGVSITAELDNFACRELLESELKSEGVWIHNRGGGTIAYFTSDDGTQYVPATTETITLTFLDDATGSPIQGINVILGTTLGATDVIDNVLSNGSGQVSVSYSGTVPQAVSGYAAKGTATPVYIRREIGGTITAGAGLVATIRMTQD